jgi:hypothetical protein
MHHRTIMSLGLILLLVGCRGPMIAPAFRRLDADGQARVNQMWNNMLARPDRLNRELLLDVMLAYELHEFGVDRASYHAEKDYAAGTVLMDVKYDREKPMEDWFFVELRDRAGKSIRKEHYTGEEVWSHFDDAAGYQIVGPALEQAATQPTTLPVTRPSTQPTDAELRSAWILARYRQITAATQPEQVPTTQP